MDIENMTPAHILVIENVPAYTPGLAKRSKRRIQETMREYGYDEDFIEAVDDGFCQGFGAARDVIVEMLERKYRGLLETGKSAGDAGKTD